ncbi:S8 family serine peptidase [Psychromarinibacter sp. C21-152]|uniref:S8 family serine peptidase n=2 Tax=Psychromarinibacter sediminicola TaxID=3033385 RepID=A0AAE3TAW6_9RHOB|nr:S8 family serine peptidase [Psychromarinibacter sediminicola]
MRHAIALLLALLLAGPAVAQTGDGDGGYDGAYGHDNDEDSQSNDSELIPDEVVRLRGGRAEFVTVGPADQAAAAAEALRAQGARVVRVRPYPNLGRYSLFLDLDGLSLARARAILDQVAPETRIDRHSMYRLTQGKPRLYAASMIDAPVETCRLTGLRIGVIDGALDPSHPALAGVRLVTHSVLDRRGGTNPNHGTAVAALIAGTDPDGVLTGFAAGADLYAVTAFGRERRGPASDVEGISAALDWLMGQGVRLVNMSFAGPQNAALDDILRLVAGRGVIMVAAAGNDGQDYAAYPAGAPGVIAVTAVDAAGRRYTAANTGPHIEFAAPGVDLYVAKRNGGSYASGTSYAAPIVTALAARLMRRGAGSTDAIRARLRSQSEDLGAPGRDTHYGWGLPRAGGC